ncbi:MAG: Ig-like domain-containing protein [Candidatus Aminicenantes bacterium]|nr:Ig-like domain-containing protein [Candidatus Aminicenantes bacterium]
MKKKMISTIVAFTVLLLSGFIFGAIPASERAALIALYNSTNGDNWANKTGWKTAPLDTDGFAMPGTEGSWNGITVTGDHVTKIKKISHKLIGHIPSELGNLSQLEEICLGNTIDYIEEIWNHLSGSIPPELGNLSNLKRLDLNYNQLSGSIPVELGNLSNLEYLNLQDNQLSGSIPTQLGNLGNLGWLVLHRNQLGGSIPPELGNLSNLEYLYLGGNQLGGSIPSQLGNLSNLLSLGLSENRLSGVIPSSFLNFTRISSLFIYQNCLSATDPVLIAWLDIHDPYWHTEQDRCDIPEIALNRTTLNFGAYNPGISLPPQTVLIGNNGTGTLNWEASGDAAPWLSFTPTSGTGDSVLSVSIDPSGLAVGDYTGEITISDPNASNSPQTVAVSLHVYDQGQTAAPFGEFATPLDGSSVYNSIPVTGWVLDDIGVATVKIYNGDAYTGDAVLVEGARPDVGAAYPTYPNNYKAGWGYMLLTNCLPNGGNGTYTFTAKATDMEGNEVTLGSKTITIDNAHAVKPFGAIDTPIQGGTASGENFINNGWALTPQPNSIPVDGSTINVVIDGVVKGHPIYNVYRWDIAWFFPGYANSNNAAGYYYIDTTKLANGVHTIAWTVTDSAGNSDGIGSRYFSIQNTGSSDQGAGGKGSEEARKCAPAFDPSSRSLVFDEIKTVEIQELERVEINLSDEGVAPQAIRVEGYSVVGDQLRELPIGSTLDKERGVFYWQPGPGFVGEYRLVFIGKDDQGQATRKNIVVNIEPKQ